jgi:hypothetical protein
MRRKVYYILFPLVLLAGAVFALLYFNGGLKQYFRARSLIYRLSPEKQEKAWSLLFGNTTGNEYGGIYAGATNLFAPIVWVWGKDGLKPHVTDEHSVYWHLDGCKVQLGQYTRINRVRDTSLKNWKGEVQVGDYVMIVITTKKMGGTKGNLREVAGMDWWGFLQSGLEEECKKQ